jgi:hypothetical protein
VTLWIGPDRHAVFYSDRTEFNPPSDRTTSRRTRGPKRAAWKRCDGRSKGGMKCTSTYLSGVVLKRSDSVRSGLNKIISCVPTAWKWKLGHYEELEKWTRVSLPNSPDIMSSKSGSKSGLGDAGHPTLPYQARPLWRGVGEVVGRAPPTRQKQQRQVRRGVETVRIPPQNSDRRQRPRRRRPPANVPPPRRPPSNSPETRLYVRPMT